MTLVLYNTKAVALLYKQPLLAFWQSARDSLTSGAHVAIDAIARGYLVVAAWSFGAVSYRYEGGVPNTTYIHPSTTGFPTPRRNQTPSPPSLDPPHYIPPPRFIALPVL
jgi:hypothetical protein